MSCKTDGCFDTFGAGTTKPRVPLQSVLTALIYAHTLLVNHLAMAETDLVGSSCVCPRLNWYLQTGDIEEQFHKGFAGRRDNGIFRIWDALFCEDAGKLTNTLKWKTKNQSLNDFFKMEFIILEILLYKN